MVHVDMTQPDRELTPGVDLWEIIQCSSKVSRKGDQMLALKLARVSDPGDHIYDNIMLAGTGWGIGKKKLGALVPKDFKGDIDPLDFLGVRLWVETVVSEYEGKERLQVNIGGLKHGGYQRAEDVPEGKELPEETAVDPDSIPF